MKRNGGVRMNYTVRDDGREREIERERERCERGNE